MKSSVDQRKLPANVKSIAKAMRRASAEKTSVIEYRIDGVRGLVLHVLPSGTATWYFHYDVTKGRQRRRRKFKIGRFDEIGLGAAAGEAERLRFSVHGGEDPAAEKTQRKQAVTFAELVDERFRSGDALRETTRRDYQSILAGDILPALGELPAEAVTRQDVLNVIGAVSARGSTRRADLARAVISAMFGFAIDRGIVSENPASGLRNRHGYNPRDTILSAEQLRRLWTALEDGSAAMSPAIARIVRLALLTGQRRTELAVTQKDDVQLSGMDPLFTIATGRAKNYNLQRVPLSPKAVLEFSAAFAAAGDSRFAFPSPDGRSHVHPRSVSKAMERSRLALGLGEIRIHDLRRTVGSMMTRFGIPKDVRERVLNHGGKRKGGVTESVYSWYGYDAEKRAALELWADALACIVSGRSSEIEGYEARLARIKGSGTIRIE